MMKVYPRREEIRRIVGTSRGFALVCLHIFMEIEK